MTPEFYALVGVGIVIVWQGGALAHAIHIAAVERREDHRELLEQLEQIARDTGSLDLVVGGIARDIAPPIDPENPPY